jgi:hypothetical protein
MGQEFNRLIQQGLITFFANYFLKPTFGERASLEQAIPYDSLFAKQILALAGGNPKFLAMDLDLFNDDAIVSHN